MGVYYYYVNETRSQYFCIDPSGRDIKQYAVGHNIGSRALSYLLLDNDEYATGVKVHPLVGSWIGDRFYITGDDYCTTFERIQAEYEDLGQQIIELLVDIDPWNLLEYGGVDWLLNLIEDSGQFVTITNEMRKRMSHEFRLARQQSPDQNLDRICAALRR
ncbi:hypothetical protein [Gimesia panareensis]|uniref:hypothetical protein n=1 Tax=Gimesia panareensis TaxID=2527978 RepID=UPI001189E9B0|nr:hypothetical protein [Gimesia panareensis]QDU53083.1 hypothetical protein Pan110_54670 [Gimesia panareensis]